jgi:pSer/pThr/pTyr-binding forkhead associated (FHA) protein
LKIVVYDHSEKVKEEREKKEKMSNAGSSTSSNQVFLFKPADSPVLIGRTKCNISLNFSFLSKRHCEIIYNKQEGVWEINDGYNGKTSTNGTWLMLKSKYEISETTFVKIGSNVIKVGLL